MGRIGGPYGVRGWVRVVSYTDPPENLTGYGPWYVKRADRWETVAVKTIRAHGDGFVAELEGVSSRDAAAAYRGAEIGVDQATLPEPDENEYYWNDLVGLSVDNLDGVHLGVVDRLMETGHHDVLVVDGESGEVLIPFVGLYVTSVDLQAGCITVDWQPDY